MLDTITPTQDAVPPSQAAAEVPALAAPRVASRALARAQAGAVPLARAVPLGWLACSAVLIAAVIAERWLLASHIFPGDPWAGRLGESHKWWLVWDITRVYQQIGRPLVAIGEVAVMAWWLWRNGGWRTIPGLVLALGASACCGLIKIICGPTPLWLELHHVGTNFPSGVVTFSTATGGYLALVAWRQGRRVMPALLIVAIIGAGPARVLGGQHLLSDVIGAYMLGAAWLIVAYTYLVATAHNAKEEVPWNFAVLETLD